jgi:hypothetical protein
MNHKPKTLQEDSMNKEQVFLVALMIVLAASLTQAQSFYPDLKGYSPEAKAQLDMTYANLLNSKNNQYIENALATVAMIKLDLPADEFPLIKNKIDVIAEHGATQTIQYKASLAKAVYANAVLFNEEAARHYDTTDAFFIAIAQKAGIASVTTNIVK